MGGGKVASVDVADWGRSLLWVALLGTAVLFSARTTEAFERPKVALVQAIALVLACGMAALAVSAHPGWPRVTAWFRDLATAPLSGGIVLSLVAAAASTSASISPRTSWLGAQGSFAGLLTLAALAVVYFAARRFCGDPSSAQAVLAGAVIGLGVTVAYGVAQVTGLDPFRWDAPIRFAGVRRVFSTQGHPNSLAQLLAAGTPLAVLFLLRAWRSQRYGQAAVLALVVAGGLGLTLLTVSRAGALALGVALVVGVSCPRPALGKGAVSTLAPLLGAVALAAVAALAFDPDGGLAALSRRLSGAADPAVLHRDLRRHLWAGAWAAFRDHPILGVGLDCLWLAFGRYRTAAGWAAEWGETPLKAHAQPLEILATRGLVGGATALVLLFGAGRAAIRAVRRPDADRGLTVAIVSSLAALGAHCLFHFPTAAGATLAAVLAGILSRLAEAGPREAETAAVCPKAGLGALVAALAAVYLVVVVPLRADVLARGATVLVHTDPARSVGLAREAVRLDPSRDLPWLRLAAALQAAGVSTSDPAARRTLLEDARRAAERAVALVPVSAYDQAHLGTLLADLERESPALSAREEVEAVFGKAADLDPVNADILGAAAGAALAAGDLDRARAWAERCAQHYPGFATPQAVLGAVSLAEGRRLAKGGAFAEGRRRVEEAVRLLKAALAGDWHGDDRARAAAEENLAKALAALAA
ncbi:MAG TPA: O-antigen ligase family protein [Vicinamibacteria bacterium]|nr:O-antigen ligase family protein [Vicinamibacteria bacterium]